MSYATIGGGTTEEHSDEPEGRGESVRGGVGFGLYKPRNGGRVRREGWMGRLRVTTKWRGETEDFQGSGQIHRRESGSS
jgi:hypothetical protein